MRRNVLRMVGTLLFVGLLMPAGMLFAVSTHQQFGITSSSANRYDTEEATTLLNQMQTLARNAKKQVARLQVQELQLTWRAQSQRLAMARYDVNKMGADLLQLDRMEKGLEPWQQTVVHKVTPEVHEMVYQLDAAIARMDKNESRTKLALTQYPQNINMIYKSANRMANIIDTVTGYAQAEQKLARLEHTNTAKSNS